jgi:hypothetical protein
MKRHRSTCNRQGAGVLTGVSHILKDFKRQSQRSGQEKVDALNRGFDMAKTKLIKAKTLPYQEGKGNINNKRIQSKVQEALKYVNL